jgi:lysophospholipase L1-like esterase
MEKPKLFVLGDSISMQYGPWLKSYISDKFAYGRKGEFEEWGDLDYASNSNGGDSLRVLTYLKEIIAERFSTDYLLLNCGLHDLRIDSKTEKHQIPVTEYSANLKKVIELCCKHNFQVIWVRTTPVDEIIHNSLSQNMHRYEADIDDYNAAADKVMTEYQVPMIDLFGFTASLDEKLFCDHAHFNESVRKLQAAYIAGYIKGLGSNV